MPFYIIGAALIIYSIFDYKKSFMFFLGFKILLVTNITVLSIPGLPILSLDNMLTIIYAFIFFINRKKFSRAKASLPWATPFFLICFTWIISSFVSVAGLNAELSVLVDNILQQVVFAWMMWELIESKDDFKFVFRVLVIIIFGTCIYGMLEYMISANPLQSYEMSLNKDTSRIVEFVYDAAGSRGYRVRSVFSHPIGAGVNWAIFSSLIAIAIVQFNDKKIRRPIYVFTAILCIPCIILSKMRSGYFFLLFAMLGVIHFRKKKYYIILAGAIVALFVAWPLISDNLYIIQSLFSGENVGGSDLATRVDQFAAAFELQSLSPIFGLGSKFQSVMDSDAVRRLLGLESIWLKTIVEYGIVGTFIYIIFALYSIVIIPMHYHSKALCFVALAYWLTYSLTSLPGINIHLLYFAMIYCIKSSTQYQHNYQSIDKLMITSYG